MIAFICMVVALILFVLAALNVPSPKVSLIALGLAFMAGSFIFTLYPG